MAEHARIVTVARIPDDVTVSAFHLEHHRRLFHALEMLERVAQSRGALEV